MFCELFFVEDMECSYRKQGVRSNGLLYCLKYFFINVQVLFMLISFLVESTYIANINISCMICIVHILPV